MKKMLVTIILTLPLLLLFPGPCQTKMLPVKKLRAGMPPYQIIKEIVTSNSTATKNSVLHSPRAEKPHVPYITWLADSDDRIQANLILANPQNRLYAVRNLGNQLVLSAGAIDYGVLELLTPVLLITGNTDNSAVSMFMNGYRKMPEDIRRDLDHLHIPLSQPAEEDEAEADFETRQLYNVERNVDYQVELATNRYKYRIREGRLVIIGGIIDLTNAYGNGPEKLTIININGVKKSDQLRKMQETSLVGSKLINVLGRKRPMIPGDRGEGTGDSKKKKK